MAYSKLIASLVRTNWLIEPTTAEGYSMLLVRLLNGEPVAFFDDDEEEENRYAPFCLQMAGSGAITTYSSYDEAPEGSIAVIPLSGVIMKEDYCGAPGTDTIARRMKEADAHPNIVGGIFKISSGGGAVAGTFECTDVITATEKVFLGYAETMACSAAYALISGCNEIWASHRTAQFGSIGTAFSLLDNTKALEERGYKQHYIRAEQSTDKNEAFIQAQKGIYAPLQQQILTPTQAIFEETVRANRGAKLKVGKDNQPLTGTVYLAEKSIELGLIDDIGTFEQAVARVYELTAEREETEGEAQTTNVSTNFNFNQMSLFAKNKLPKLTALAGKEADKITTEDLNAVNEELTANNITGVNLVNASIITAAEKATQDLDAANALLKTANASVASLTAEKTTLTNKVAELEKATGAPGANQSNPLVNGNQEVEPSLSALNQKEIDDLPHNRALDQNPMFAFNKGKV